MPEDVRHRLSIKLLYDLKETRESLRQTSRNSSRPPSSDLPWDKTNAGDDGLHQQGQDESAGEDNHTLDVEDASKTGSKEKSPAEADETQPTKQPEAATNETRKAGKQLGAPGCGREQKIEITAEAHHCPENYVRCDRELKPDSAKAYTAFETVDLEWADCRRNVLARNEHAALVMGILRSRCGRLLDRRLRFRVTGQCIRQRFSMLADH